MKFSKLVLYGGINLVVNNCMNTDESQDINTYTITYHTANFNTDLISSYLKTYDIDADIQLDVPDIDYFKSWIIDNELYSEYDIFRNSIKNINIDAYISCENEYSLTYLPNGASGNNIIDKAKYEAYLYEDENDIRIYKHTDELILSACLYQYRNHKFTSWKIDQTYFNPGSKIILTSNISAEAQWNILPKCNVYAEVFPISSGNIIGTGSYDNGSLATLAAVRNPGYIFCNWSNGSTTSNILLNMTSDIYLTAFLSVYVNPHKKDPTIVSSNID